MAIEQYLRNNKLPHIWCPGCGHGIILGSILRAIEKMDWDQDKVVVVSGIGCSSRAPGYMDFDTIHTVHGRAIAYATGIKMANPDLHVLVITGDGDGAAIGGNHLIHASRRNIDINVVLFNNTIYGMTSGQFSPMTPAGALSTTSPHGNVEPPFDICALVKGAGASFVARGTAYHTHKLIQYMVQGFENKGFSFIEASSYCPTYYGRRNKLGNAVDMLQWQKENAVDIKKANQMQEEELSGKLITGIYAQRNMPEYTANYWAMVQRLQEGNADG